MRTQIPLLLYHLIPHSMVSQRYPSCLRAKTLSGVCYLPVPTTCCVWTQRQLMNQMHRLYLSRTRPPTRRRFSHAPSVLHYSATKRVNRLCHRTLKASPPKNYFLHQIISLMIRCYETLPTCVEWTWNTENHSFSGVLYVNCSINLLSLCCNSSSFTFVLILYSALSIPQYFRWRISILDILFHGSQDEWSKK